MSRIVWSPQRLPNFRLLLERDKGRPARDREMRTIPMQDRVARKPK